MFLNISTLVVIGFKFVDNVDYSKTESFKLIFKTITNKKFLIIQNV